MVHRLTINNPVAFLTISKCVVVKDTFYQPLNQIWGKMPLKLNVHNSCWKISHIHFLIPNW